MMRTLVARGMLAGLVAAVLATVFAYFRAESAVEAAISVEEAHSTAEAAAEPLVSRDVQSTIGLFTGIAGYAIAAGGLFALVFAVLYGRITTTRPAMLSALLATGCYVVAVLVPFLKYPANPPAVGSAATIEERTGLYFGFLGLSLVLAVVALYTAYALRDRLPGIPRAGAAVGIYVVGVVVCGALFPTVDEVTPEFSATTLWNFRVGSLGTTLVLWAVLGGLFGYLADRSLTGRREGGNARLSLAAQ